MKLILVIAAVLFFSGCATAPVSYDKFQEGNWKAKALVKDRDQNRSYIVALNFNAVRGKQVRMDVSTTLGGPVAALASDQKEVHYLLVDVKKFYYGSTRPDVMRPILSIPFDPRWLHNLLFEIPFTDKGWTCQNDGKYLAKCSEAGTGLTVTWASRVGERRTIQIEHKRANVQLNIQSFQAKVEDRKDLFDLKAPSAFEKLNLR